MAGIYIHIPFCKRLCHYCDFYFSVSLQRKEEILQALLREMELRREYLGGTPVKTLYIGGGTPSVCRPDELNRLIGRCMEVWEIDTLDELTVEANPEDLDRAYIRALRNTPVTRLSVGVQSFQNDLLRLMNRRHTGATALRAVRDLQEAGFENLSLDLIYGIPSMTESQWEQDLETALGLAVPHLSAYHLTVEPRTVFGNRMKRGLFRPVDEETGERHYAILEEKTRQAGYAHYEISNFARPGFEALHNSNYWKGEKYIGLGPSAHSYNKVGRRWNVASNKLYLERLEKGTYYEEETLSLYDRYNEYVMTSLRTARGIDTDLLRKEFGPELSRYFRKEVSAWFGDRQLHEEAGRIFLKSRDFLISDFLISRLFYTEP